MACAPPVRSGNRNGDAARHPTTANVNGREPVVEAVQIEPGGEARLVVAYKTQGLDR